MHWKRGSVDRKVGLVDAFGERKVSCPCQESNHDPLVGQTVSLSLYKFWCCKITQITSLPNNYYVFSLNISYYWINPRYSVTGPILNYIWNGTLLLLRVLHLSGGGDRCVCSNGEMMICDRNRKALWEDPTSVPLLPPWSCHEAARHWTRDSAVSNK